MPQHDIPLVIDDPVLQRFPTFSIVTLTVRGFHGVANQVVSPYRPEQIETSAIGQIADWRQAYREMGLRASKYFSSLEALVRRAAKGDESWMTPFPAVNFYNRISLGHLATIGAYDLKTLVGSEIRVRELVPDRDQFRPLGGKTNFPMQSGIVVYATADNVLCWAINHRDSADYCLRDTTDDVLFVSEAISEIQKVSTINAILEIEERCRAAGAVCSSPRLFDIRTPAGRTLTHD